MFRSKYLSMDGVSAIRITNMVIVYEKKQTKKKISFKLQSMSEALIGELLKEGRTPKTALFPCAIISMSMGKVTHNCM